MNNISMVDALQTLALIFTLFYYFWSYCDNRYKEKIETVRSECVKLNQEVLYNLCKIHNNEIYSSILHVNKTNELSLQIESYFIKIDTFCASIQNIDGYEKNNKLTNDIDTLIEDICGSYIRKNAEKIIIYCNVIRRKLDGPYSIFTHLDVLYKIINKSQGDLDSNDPTKYYKPEIKYEVLNKYININKKDIQKINNSIEVLNHNIKFGPLNKYNAKISYSSIFRSFLMQSNIIYHHLRFPFNDKLPKGQNNDYMINVKTYYKNLLFDKNTSNLKSNIIKFKQIYSDNKDKLLILKKEIISNSPQTSELSEKAYELFEFIYNTDIS